MRHRLIYHSEIPHPGRYRALDYHFKRLVGMTGWRWYWLNTLKTRLNITLKIIVTGLVLLYLPACTTPTQRIDQQAEQLKFNKRQVTGTDFTHIVYLNNAWGQEDILHVYLEGDGSPWLHRYVIAADPTPRNPLMLRLMAQDEKPSLYLGRPCYYGQADIPPCSPRLWTSQRYGPEVVASMATALRNVLLQSHYQKMVLIGYSGGGTLAMLLAEHFLPQTRAVLTIAGNLDPDRWTELHHYSRLNGSLNPAQRQPLATQISQLHYAGGRDQNIPVNLIKQVIDRQHYAKLEVIDDYDHSCCWEKSWPMILNELAQSLQQVRSEAAIALTDDHRATTNHNDSK